MKPADRQEMIQTGIFDMVMAVYTVFHKRVFQRLKGTGLTVGQPKVLDFLTYAGTAIQKNIAQACEIEPSTAARLLNKMEESGLIQRGQIRGNRRAIYVSLTEQGRGQAARVQEAFDSCEKAAFAGFTEDRRENLVEILERMEENLRQRAELPRAALSGGLPLEHAKSADSADLPESSKRLRCQEGQKRFASSFHERLRTCQSLLYRQLFFFLKGTGLTPGQPKILEFLEKKEGCQQKEIAAACRIKPATVTSLLLYMEKADLIQRQAGEEDRRALHVYLTEKGRSCMEQTMDALKETIAAAFAGMENRQEEFRKDMLQIRQNLEERGIYD